MKRIFTLLTIICTFSFLNAQETYCFRTDAPQGLNIENSTKTGLSLHYVLNEIIGVLFFFGIIVLAIACKLMFGNLASVF